MADYKKVLSILKRKYGLKFFSKRNPFEVLVSCVLSLRTKDEVSYAASKRLFNLAKTPKGMLKLKPKVIEKTIYPVGFYRVKTRTILGICKKLVEEYNSKVPDTVEELLNFKGVGRKTANIVVTFGYK
ncbi:MAG: endonuclease III, partial [Candidatus Diapherotrites archaeon]|nr:endonuclease III [Candidatus Diapherotrites archaeon]